MEDRQFDGPSRSRGSARIKDPRAFLGGLVIAAIALVAWWQVAALSSMRGFSFGAGTMPRVLATILFALGCALVVAALTKNDGTTWPVYSYRGPIWISASILVFAFTVMPLGLPIAAFASFLIAAAATDETNWGEAILAAIAMSALCVGLFVYVLSVPFNVFPQW